MRKLFSQDPLPSCEKPSTSRDSADRYRQQLKEILFYMTMRLGLCSGGIFPTLCSVATDP